MRRIIALLAVVGAMLVAASGVQASIIVDTDQTCVKASSVKYRSLANGGGGGIGAVVDDGGGGGGCQPGYFWIDVYTYDENGHYHNWHCQYLCDGYNVIQLQCME